MQRSLSLAGGIHKMIPVVIWTHLNISHQNIDADF